MKGAPDKKAELLEAYTDAIIRNSSTAEIDYLREQAVAAGATATEIDRHFDDGWQINQGSPASVRA